MEQGIIAKLTENKTALLTKWFHLLLEIYPKETTKHFKAEKSQFANPVGSNIHQGLSSIYDELVGNMDKEILRKAIDKIVRIEAVQDIGPSQSCSFLFLFKKVLRESIDNEITLKLSPQDLALLEARIDELVLLSFDIYMECRETIYKLRVHELKTRCDILERVNSYN
ncbi:MAG: RsbRD N-terminal domain-containing protein [Bacillota bacterium]